MHVKALIRARKRRIFAGITKSNRWMSRENFHMPFPPYEISLTSSCLIVRSQKRYRVTFLLIWSCLNLPYSLGFQMAPVWVSYRKFRTSTLWIPSPSARKLTWISRKVWDKILSAAFRDKDLGEMCKKDCEDVYVNCIQSCGDSDCYLDCGRDLSYCSDGI